MRIAVWIPVLMTCSSAFASQMSDATRYLWEFKSMPPCPCATNGSVCVRTVAHDEGRVEFESEPESGRLEVVQLWRNDGGITRFEFGTNSLDYVFESSSNAVDGVLTTYFWGKIPLWELNLEGYIYRIENDVVGGETVGRPRCYWANGKECPPFKHQKHFLEYAAGCGTALRVGPYYWVMLGYGEISALMRNGRVVLMGLACGITGKYPWIVARYRSWRSWGDEEIAIDIRSDTIFTLNDRTTRERLLEDGIDVESLRVGGKLLRGVYNLRDISMAKGAEERWKNLNASLQSPKAAE